MDKKTSSASPSQKTPDTAALPLAELTAQVRRIGRQNQRLFQQLMADEKKFRRLAKSVWRVQEEERRRLAGELHDGLGQTLTALKIQLVRLASERRDETRTPEADKRLAADLDGAAHIAHEALNEARRLSHLLRPQVLDDLGLEPALRWLTRTLREWTGFEIELETIGFDDRRFDPDVETLVFRVVQESLTNAMKHSGAAGATVRVKHSPERRRLRLRVADQGAGFDLEAEPASGSGHGLRGIEDRVQIFGGKLVVRSRPGEGTIIEAELPLAAEEETTP